MKRKAYLGLLFLTTITAIEITVLPGNENWPYSYVSVGQAGVWAVNHANILFYRSSTYNNNANSGDRWRRKAEHVQQVDVGFDKVYYISNKDNELFEITNVGKDNPFGQAVKKKKQHAKCIALSTRTDAFYSVFIDMKDQVRRRHPKKYRFTWKSLNLKAQSLTDGPAGIWATNPILLYRTQTIGNRNTTGLEWVEVDPGPFTHVTSGSGVVLAVYENGTLVQRTGVTCSKPEGTGWTNLMSNVSQVDSYGAVAWAVDTSGYLHFIEL